MKTAEQIMKSKHFIKEELDRQLPKTLSDELWKKAEARLAGYMRQYAGIPKGERTHTDNFIFPAAAIYLTMKEVTTQEQAYDVIEKAAIRNSGDAGRKLAKLMRAPAMRSLFVWIWDPMTKKMFGVNSGFQNVFYPKVKGEYRMDVVSCTYCRYFTELGCPEITKARMMTACMETCRGLSFEGRARSVPERIAATSIWEKRGRHLRARERRIETLREGTRNEGL